jgi:hypothetical protein
VKASDIYPSANTAANIRGVQLGPPVPLADISGKEQPFRSPESVQPVTPAPPRTESLSARLELLHRGDKRFGALRIELRENTVTVSGPAERGADLMAFASAIARLPGVERVITRTDEPDTP